MIKRYEQPEISAIWEDQSKLAKWQKVELAAVQGRANLRIFPEAIPGRLEEALSAHPIDIEWWLQEDKKIHHDLNAFLAERRRFLPADLEVYFHKNMTSFDTEDPAFAMMLKESLKVVGELWQQLNSVLRRQAQAYRFTVMYARTHGQGGKAQTFGKRILTWLRDLQQAYSQLREAAENLRFSKLSGAVGNYGGLSPEEEAETLRILGFQPYYGATQIMPRIMYATIAQGLANFTLQMAKVARDFRLGARSGRPLYQEPFASVQKGSSAMPHKKNPIITEQMEGMARLALGCAISLTLNIVTDEERAIEQSCVERVSFPDLLHIVVHCLRRLSKVLDGMRVYPDNMLLELVESGGCYASDEAKETLKMLLAGRISDPDECYRIVQLAAFNVFENSTDELREIRGVRCTSLEEAERRLAGANLTDLPEQDHIARIIEEARLRPSSQLEASPEQVGRWNSVLAEVLSDRTKADQWQETFKVSKLLRHEEMLFRQILGY